MARSSAYHATEVIAEAAIISTLSELLRNSMFGFLNSGSFGNFVETRRAFLVSRQLDNWQETPTESIEQLGASLADMFLLAHGGKNGQRDNSSVAIAGALWESLVIAYLNTVLAGSSAVVIKGVAHVPVAFREMFTISGPSGIVSPSYSTFVLDHPCLSQSVDSGTTSWDKELTHWLDNEIRREPEQASVILLDCRTNFSDLVKETVLYDWLLNILAKGQFPDQMLPQYQSIELIELLPRLGSLSVALVTGQRRAIKPSAAPARRGMALTGKTFWGLETVDGVASCLSSFKRIQQTLGNLRASGSHLESTAHLRAAAIQWLGP